MLNHVMVGSNDIDRSKQFYDAVLAVLGAPAPVENINATGQKRLFYRHKKFIFSVSEPINGEPATVANGSTIGFVCESPEQLQHFHDTAVAHGGTAVEDPPGPRENNMGVLYLCYFLDPDGHKICGLYRPPRDA